MKDENSLPDDGIIICPMCKSDNDIKDKGYKEIGIGFGLYADYGSAQKLYFRLGYAPDGHGVTYKYQATTPGESYPLDDELILWLKKNL